jgi:myo-inositol-1(or 4)-monophosphatase
MSVVTEQETNPLRLRSVAEQLATEAAAFVRRRRVEVFGTAGRHDADDAAVRS